MVYIQQRGSHHDQTANGTIREMSVRVSSRKHLNEGVDNLELIVDFHSLFLFYE